MPSAVRRRRLFMGGASSFNPLTDPTVPLLAGLWADDLTLADGANVVTWPNRGSVAGDPTQATALLQPVLRKTPAGFNGHAAVEFTAASLQVLDVAWAPVQPLHLFAVYRFKSNATTYNLLGNGSATTRGLRQIAAGTLQVSYGATLTDGATSTAVSVARSLVNNTSSTLTINEAAGVAGSAGAANHGRLTVGAASDVVPTFAGYLDGFLAFLGVASASAVSVGAASDYARKLMALYAVTG